MTRAGGLLADETPSCRRYNSLGALDEHVIAQLSFVARLSARIRAAPADDDHDHDDDDDDDDAVAESPHALARHLPSFVWVLRDFALDLVDEADRALTPDEYLERALAPTGRAESDATRRALAAYFPARACRTLPRPYADEAALRGDAARGAPRRAFSSALRELRRTLLDDALRCKTVHGVALRGGTFGALAERYVNVRADNR